ncbi:bifunctional arginine demethylase and lysyl-hydroxylase JMJD6-B [Diorhabda sublineata]|uniref:bifunctional arginine demethylase and lysyl-hydroxylase JMJD6-B n=1 Tax=Diorhabda sublineata TaxID=1163346 RepID=UPI0024E0A9DD|nr:bifunctional arginine demethylase and lysyl-hydroxylase JMJD6-B [Diorhabda sublineata]
MFHTSECLIDISSYTSKVFREPENCDFCTNVSTVDKLSKISPINFYELYQKPARPLIVTDAIEHWPASKTFEYKFFKELYENFKFDGSSKKNCQFFPYKTNFKSLSEVFQMSEKRANLAAGEKSWYVGWNNCNDKAGKILRQYYSKPYFLGNRTENIAMSWIFMGGPGHGAQMHVDNVYYPSWQAQLRGRKLWILAPPPECWNSCQKLEAEVKTGETIVVDTNRWYHQTIVLPGEISITIGSEFD